MVYNVTDFTDMVKYKTILLYMFSITDMISASDLRHFVRLTALRLIFWFSVYKGNSYL